VKSLTDACATLLSQVTTRTPYKYANTCLPTLAFPQTNLSKTTQWARDRRNAELDRDSDIGPEDMFDAALRGGHRGDDEADEFVETMMLVVLCLIVSLLLYIRGRWVERLRREERQQRQQQQVREERDEGLFPPPGDPARDDWAIPR
jgi:SEL1 protein